MPTKRIEDIKIKEKDLFTAIIGNIDDVFIDSDLRKYTFKEQLYLYLKNEGFERIVFYDVVGGLHSYEESSLQLLLGEKKDHKLVSDGRPFGTTTGRLKAEPTNSSMIKFMPEATKNYFQIADVKNDALFAKLETIISEKGIKTALIFSSTIINPSKEIGERFLTSLEEINGSYAKNENRNKIIINYQQKSEDSFVDFVSSESGTSFFQNVFFKEQFLLSNGGRNLTNRVSKILPPDELELRNVLNLYRLKGIEDFIPTSIEWNSFDKLNELLCREEKTCNCVIKNIGVKKPNLSVTSFVDSKIVKSESITLDYEIIDEQLRNIKGQDENIGIIKKSINTWARSKSKPRKPLSFFVVGPTGVGKTYAAKLFAKGLEKSGYDYLQLSMNEYRTEADASKLIGSPPGYIGYNDTPELFKKIQENRRLFICFDEIEKADESILTLLMQLIDEGRLSNNNYEGDFKECVLYFTSNLAATDVLEEKKKVVNEMPKNPDTNELIDKFSRKTFKDTIRGVLKNNNSGIKIPTEVWGRIKNYIVFNKLDAKAIMEIAINSIRKIAEEQYGYNIEKIDPRFLAKIAETYVNSDYGIRDLETTLSDELENLFSND